MSKFAINPGTRLDFFVSANAPQGAPTAAEAARNASGARANAGPDSYGGGSTRPSSLHLPKATAGASPATAPQAAAASTPAGTDTDAVARTIAQNFADHYTYVNGEGKTVDQAKADNARTEATHQGLCADFAVEAAKEFEAQGVNARVVTGQVNGGHEHAFVEYQDGQGQWQLFDPTAAACTQEPQTAVDPQGTGAYRYENIDAYYDAA